MVIIAYFGSTVNEYREKCLKNLLDMCICCPNHPECKMAKHGHYIRGIKETGEKIEIYRLICYKCRETITVLPDFLLPYKQYSANEIEAVLIDAETIRISDIDTEASESTVRRWDKVMGKEVEVWLSLLKAHVFKIKNKIVSELKLKGLSLVDQLETIKTSNAKGLWC